MSSSEGNDSESSGTIQSQAKRQKLSSHKQSGRTKSKLRAEYEYSVAMDSSSEVGTRAQGTIYDAVAGRLDDDGFILNGQRKPAAPDEVLFRRKGAPVRYEEDDRYFAHRHLPPHITLPDSDLLKIIHAYASDFYASAFPDKSAKDYCSMDETALMAMGILLEEACRHSLGETGDLAFVEVEETSQNG